jgi:hypothetical protein
VVVLVTGKGGSTGECLLAIGVRTLVGTLSRVCPAVTGKRAAVTEGLGTSFAMVRLLACVDSLMHSQGRSLNKLLATRGPVTDVGSNTTVNAFMTSKIAASREAFSTGAARVCLDGLLGRGRRLMMLLLLRHVLHVHVRHATHVGHLGVAGQTHGGGHRVGDMHRCLHRGWRWVGSCDVVRVGVLRVLGAVRRGGSLHTGFVLNEGMLVLVVIEETGSKLLHLTFLIEHVGDVHNLRRSW